MNMCIYRQVAGVGAYYEYYAYYAYYALHSTNQKGERVKKCSLTGSITIFCVNIFKKCHMEQIHILFQILNSDSQSLIWGGTLS